jgi:hypothetical protein
MKGYACTILQKNNIHRAAPTYKSALYLILFNYWLKKLPTL